MKKIIFIVLIFLICQNVLAEKITYKIKPYFSSLEPYILIDLEYIADSSGETKLLLPSNWVDLKNPADDFYDINISPNAFTRKKNYFLVYSKPNEPITIQYKIKHQADHAFKTKITHSYFQFIGKTVFILPDVSFDKKQEIKLEWSDNNIFNSYGFKSKTQNLVTDLEDFSNSLFIGGKINDFSYQKDKNNIVVIVQMSDPEKQKKIANLTKEIIFSQLETMEDVANDYLISILDSESTASAGTHLNNAFTLVVNNAIQYRLDTFLYYIAHEHFHHWIGKKIRTKDSYLSEMWFIEGFNDFFSTLHAYENNLISFNRYIEIYNQILKNQLLSPFDQIPLSKIEKSYWKKSCLQQYPYYKGHIFAQKINYLFRKNNTNASFIDVVKKIIKDHPERDELEVNSNDILFLLNQYTNLPVSTMWLDFFEKGKAIDFPKEIGDKKNRAKLIWIKNTKADYGFDLKDSYSFYIATQVKPNSPAAKAGLKNGDIIEDFHFTTENQLLTLTIKTNLENYITLDIKPVKKVCRIPQYRIMS